MHGHHILRVLAVASLLLTAGGCTKFQEASPSGFLENYAQLQPSKEFPGARIYSNPDKTAADYDRFMADPVVVRFSPDAEGAAIDPAKVKALASYLDEQLRKAISERYELTETPGPRVIRIRAALTDIRPRQHQVNPRKDELPIWPGGATIEIEAVDSQSGQRVLAVMDSVRGTIVKPEEQREFDDVREALRRAGERLTRLVRFHHPLQQPRPRATSRK